MGNPIGSLLNSDTQILRPSVIKGHTITYEAFARAVFWDLRAFHQNLQYEAFARGLPRKEYFQDTLKDVFSVVLEEGFLDARRLPESHAGAVGECFRMGWLHKSLKTPDDDDAGEMLVFPSPLHRWYIPQPSGIGSITNYSSGMTSRSSLLVDPQQYLDFIISVLRQLKPSQLSRPSRQPGGSLASPQEAQYGAEFYRACHSYSGGSILPSPEWGLKIKCKGAIDFFLPGYDLAIELAREGLRLGEQYERFLPGGCYNQ